MWYSEIESGQRQCIILIVCCYLENASQEEIDALRSELDQMIFVGKHPNVVSLLGACTENGEINLQSNFVITVDSSKFIQMKHKINFHLLFVTFVFT